MCDPSQQIAEDGSDVESVMIVVETVAWLTRILEVAESASYLTAKTDILRTAALTAHGDSFRVTK